MVNVPEVSTEISARASRGRGNFLETLESTIRFMEQMPASKSQGGGGGWG